MRVQDLDLLLFGTILEGKSIGLDPPKKKKKKKRPQRRAQDLEDQDAS
jgi:hypothetical protein